MPQPTASDVHVNAPLTGISIGFMQDQSGFVARKAFPTVPVQKQSDRYYLYEKKQWFRSDARKRAPATESAGSGYTVDNTPNYYCDVRAVHKDVDDQVRANSDSALSPDRDATEFVTRDLMLEQELDWRDTYFATNVWSGGTGGLGSDFSPTTKWDAANSTPIEELRAEMRSVHQKSAQKCNKLIMGPLVWDVIADHPDFLERIKYTERGIVGPDLLAALLGLDEVLIADAIQDLGVEGAAENLDYLFGDAVLLVYANPAPGLMKPSAGYTFAWTGLFGSNAAGMRVSRFRMEHLKADRVEGEAAYDHKVVASECGAFLTNVLT